MKKRSYKQNCSLAFASDILGERWTLLLFRELFIQPCRFKQLSLWLKGMGTNLLAARLKELEQEGLIEKQQPENKRSAYQLTPAGLAVEPIILAMIRWGYVFGHAEADNMHFAHWDLLAMKAFFNSAKGQREMTVQFSTESFQAWVKVSKSGLNFALGNAASADIVIEASIADFQQTLAHGDASYKKKGQAFIQWFDLPELESKG